MDKRTLEDIFPNLKGTPYQITSPFDVDYNCIAWAAEDSNNWWEPDPFNQYFWPSGIGRHYSLRSYQQAYELIGFQICESVAYNKLYDRIALFSDIEGRPTHATRQLASGFWTSKLGRDVDIEHELHAIEGEFYGHVFCIMERIKK